MSVDKLVDSTQLESDLTSVANAIRTKGGTSGSLAFPSGFVSAISNIPTGGGTATNGDVNFYDYDGTLVASKTKSEINAMTNDTDLPSNPTHNGLTAQGWNWTVAQLKAQLTAMPDQPIDVGQMYVTTSGATEIDVVMKEGRLSPILGIGVSGTAYVDWGDNTTPDSVTGTTVTSKKDVSHTYSSAGSYTIKITVEDGTSLSLIGSNSAPSFRRNNTTSQNYVYSSCVRKVRIGNGMTTIRGSFYHFYTLSEITIPNTVTSINGSSFYNCYSLSCVIVPKNTTVIESNVFNSCYSLSKISLPSTITSIGSSAFSSCALSAITLPSGLSNIYSGVFNACVRLSEISIPSTITTIPDNMCYGCYSLSKISLPSTITSIGNNAFYGCYMLNDISIPNNVESIGTSAFYYCYSLREITIPSKITRITTSMLYNCHGLKKVILPNTLTSIGNSAFSYCHSLCEITIPNNVTSIEDSAFSYCRSLSNVTIPSNVASIGNSVFSNCAGVAEYHFLQATVPTVGTNLFQSNTTDFIMYVPQGTLSDYQANANLSSYASNMQEEAS